MNALSKILLIALSGSAVLFAETATPKQPAASVMFPEFPEKLPTFGEPDIPGWTRVNDRFRQKMAPSTAYLCGNFSKESPEQELKRRGSHTQAFTETFVNASAKAAMFSEKTPVVFPVGSVIIKVKYANERGGAALLRTIMIKREKGYNPECGDWEFVTTDAAGVVTGKRGKLQSCMECHQKDGVKNDDHTYRRDYLPASVLTKIKTQAAPPEPGVAPKS